MRQIFVLRHAQALSSGGLSDRERKLSPKGLDDARALGVLMRAKGYQPDLALCSPAVRTRETLDCVLEALEAPKIDYIENIYNGSLDDYLALLQNVHSEFDRVLIVGHNPIIHALAANLALDDGSAEAGRLTMGYAPGTLTVLEFAGDRWSDLVHYENKVQDLIAPGG